MKFTYKKIIFTPLENHCRKAGEVDNKINNKQGQSRYGSIFLAGFIILIVLFSFNVGFWFGSKQIPFVGTGKIINEEVGKVENIDFSLFWDVWQTLEKKFVGGSIDRQKMFYGAISGMVKGLGDPYTVFMSPQETKEFSEELKGSFEGIGAEIGIKKNILTIIAPLKDSPAEKAGLKAGDKILKIDETITADLTIEEAVKFIRGPKDTEVKLMILRDAQDKPKEVVVKRDVIILKSAQWEMKDSNIAYLKLSRFGEDTSSILAKIADEIIASDARAIILDLRNNPGGLLDSAISVAGFFISGNKVVAIEEFGDGKQKPYYAPNNSRLENLPLVVLINQGSASASEILAGALRDIRSVKLIGEASFGKGSVQELEELRGGSSIRITVAKWLTPSGKNINEEGLKPDIEVKLTEEDYENNRDPQLDEAMKILK